MKKILIVEDDTSISEELKKFVNITQDKKE